MKKGGRKVWMYVLTFVTCMAIDIYAIAKGSMAVPFDGNFVFLIFTAFAGGATAEHFANKTDKKGEQDNGTN